MYFSSLSGVAFALLSQLHRSSVVGQIQLVDGKGLFSYDPVADNGPKFWPALETADPNQCMGDRQSPVGINAIPYCSLTNAEYNFNGGTCPTGSLVYYNNDHSVEAEYPEDGSCEPSSFSMPKIDGTFEITQFHTHTGSEHAFEGIHSNFELHCVHKLKEGTGKQEVSGITKTQAVVGFFIIVQGEDDNDEFQPLLDGWQEYQDNVLAECNITPSPNSGSRRHLLTQRQLQDGFNVYDLVKPTSYFHYTGSLTTPPCTEDLWWNIANDPIIISVKQGNQLSQLILGYLDDTCQLATGANPFTGWTSRPLQPLNGRTVSRYCLGDGETAPPGESGGATSYMAWTVSFVMLALHMIMV